MQRARWRTVLSPSERQQGETMKRRDFTAGIALAVLAPAIARAKPGNLVETPGLAEQVKSGGLPAVAKRIPEVPSVVKRFSGVGRSRPLRRPGQHAGRQRARYAPDDALRQRAADRVRRPVQAPIRHPRKLRGQGRPRVHPEAARRPQVVRRRRRSRPRTSATSGRTSPTTRSCRRADRTSSCWSTASRPRSRSSIR